MTLIDLYYPFRLWPRTLDFQWYRTSTSNSLNIQLERPFKGCIYLWQEIILRERSGLLSRPTNPASTPNSLVGRIVFRTSTNWLLGILSKRGAKRVCAWVWNVLRKDVPVINPYTSFPALPTNLTGACVYLSHIVCLTRITIQHVCFKPYD